MRARAGIRRAAVVGALAAAATWAPSGSASAAVHPNSASQSRIEVRGAEVRVDLRLQATSILEIADADRNLDAFLDAGELEAARDAIGAYVLEHFRLRTDSLGDPERGRALEGRLEALGSPMVAPDPIFTDQPVDLVLSFGRDGGGAPLADLMVTMTLFAETSPAHFDDSVLIWNGEEPVRRILRAGARTWYVRPGSIPRTSTLRDYLGLGVEHIRTGLDHLAFLLALLVGSRSLRSLLGTVTAFTVAHSVTLALAALGVVHLEPRLVELVIALSIAYVAADDLLRRAPRGLWIEAFVFGLVHGLGFSGFLQRFLTNEPHRLTALVGFNLGVEVGQIAFVLVATLALALLPGRRRAAAEEGEPPGGLVPVWIGRPLSILVLAAGLTWFVQRAWLS